MNGSDKNEGNKIKNWMASFINENEKNYVSIKVDEDDRMQCIFIQSYFMVNWLKKFPEVLHIDSTFKVNVENYLLFIIMVQNGESKGVPIAYCLMNTDSKENIEFMYDMLKENNDLCNTKCIIIDKDLTNVDVIRNYFENAKILLCSFHVLKYLKSYIHKLEVPIDQRKIIMNAVRSILYSKNETEMSDQIQIIKSASKSTNFIDYFEKNWMSCVEMWVIKYRNNTMTFGYNTNNHIESYNRQLKRVIKSSMHMSETIQLLMEKADNLYYSESCNYLSLKTRIESEGDCELVKHYHQNLTKHAIKLINEQNKVLLTNNYIIEEKTDNVWRVYKEKIKIINNR